MTPLNVKILKFCEAFNGWWELKTAIPGVSDKAHLLRSPLAVPAHQESEGQMIVGAVLRRWRRPSFYTLPALHLHVFQSGVVHHHKALLAGHTNIVHQMIFDMLSINISKKIWHYLMIRANQLLPFINKHVRLKVLFFFQKGCTFYHAEWLISTPDSSVVCSRLLCADTV